MMLGDILNLLSTRQPGTPRSRENAQSILEPAAKLLIDIPRTVTATTATIIAAPVLEPVPVRKTSLNGYWNLVSKTVRDLPHSRELQ